MLPGNVLLTPHILATPFCEMRLGSGVSLTVMERLRNVTPPAHGVSVGVAPAGDSLRNVADAPAGEAIARWAAPAGAVVSLITPASRSKNVDMPIIQHNFRIAGVSL
jgi:hypothetical protein